ncbi:MAG TPA: polyprenyl synthetase family protein [Streptosporangiaceae bacterium]|jgi:heptaprenyl diphosphate synthase
MDPRATRPPTAAGAALIAQPFRAALQPWADRPAGGPLRACLLPGRSPAAPALPAPVPAAAGGTLAPELSARLEALMCDTALAMAGPLGEPLIRVIRAGGKKLRPALTMAVAAIGGLAGDDPRVLAAAAAVELLHCAALVHDDLIDGAPLRRGVATLSAHEGRAAAVVGGDLLIAAACALAGEVSRDASVIMAQTLGQLCRGEAVQDQLRYDALAPVERLMEVTRLKTGSLLRAACLLGAESFDAAPGLCAAVADFGMDLGICVQLVDDLLDVVSSPALTAKPVGADFSSGTLTLPIALAIRECPELGELLRPGLDPVSGERAMALLRGAGDALASTAATARDHAILAGQRLRDAAGGQAAAEQLTGWPLAYLDSQLESKVGDQHRWLVSPLASPAP